MQKYLSRHKLTIRSRDYDQVVIHAGPKCVILRRVQKKIRNKVS